MMQPYQLNNKFVGSKQYLDISIVIDCNYLYLVYYDINGMSVLNQFPIVNNYKAKKERNFVKISTINRDNTNMMCLSSIDGDFNIVRRIINERKDTDILIDNNYYKTLMSIVFKARSLYDNKFNCWLLC